VFASGQLIGWAVEKGLDLTFRLHVRQNFEILALLTNVSALSVEEPAFRRYP
jgi:hypothetical protein